MKPIMAGASSNEEGNLQNFLTFGTVAPNSLWKEVVRERREGRC